MPAIIHHHSNMLLAAVPRPSTPLILIIMTMSVFVDTMPVENRHRMRTKRESFLAQTMILENGSKPAGSGIWAPLAIAAFSYFAFTLLIYGITWCCCSHNEQKEVDKLMKKAKTAAAEGHKAKPKQQPKLSTHGATSSRPPPTASGPRLTSTLSVSGPASDSKSIGHPAPNDEYEKIGPGVLYTEESAEDNSAIEMPKSTKSQPSNKKGSASSTARLLLAGKTARSTSKTGSSTSSTGSSSSYSGSTTGSSSTGSSSGSMSGGSSSSGSSSSTSGLGSSISTTGSSSGGNESGSNSSTASGSSTGGEGSSSSERSRR